MPYEWLIKIGYNVIMIRGCIYVNFWLCNLAFGKIIHLNNNNIRDTLMAILRANQFVEG